MDVRYGEERAQRTIKVEKQHRAASSRGISTYQKKKLAGSAKGTIIALLVIAGLGWALFKAAPVEE